MKHIVSISFASSALNQDFRFNFSGKEFRVSVYGSDFKEEVMKSLIKRFDGVADVIALQGLQAVIKIRGKTLLHRDSQAMRNLVQTSELVTGDLLRGVFQPWVVRSLVKKHPQFLKNKKIAFYSGLSDFSLVEALSEHSDQLSFMDPYFHFRVRKELRGLDSLQSYLKKVSPLAVRLPLGVRVRKSGEKPRLTGLSDADVYVTRATLLDRFSLDHLKGKSVLIDVATPNTLKQLENAGVKNVFQLVPTVTGIGSPVPKMNFAVLEGILQILKDGPSPLDEDEIIRWIEELNLQPDFTAFEGVQNETPLTKFAFIIHPLSLGDLFRHPLLKPARPLLKKAEPALEWVAARAPGVYYGKIEGVESVSTGAKTEGLIYCVFETPKMMLSKDPESMYKRLVEVCHTAKKEGAEIIGLGAYTKIVGDAGITVSKRSPIPVTTGNSLSAAATLWAAREACLQLGFLPPYKSGQIIRAKAMIIGATGSIGAVCAKMLANVVDEIVICSRTAGKLLELKDEISVLAPHCKIKVVTNPNKDAGDCDLIVTSTSSHDKRVLDILAVKPGCVICDVSRPLDIREEDALKRPDVLVVESGEIQLPGNFSMTCDIGTPDSVVYACLAETALLALEGRLESYTLSRNISYQKVREIYDLAKKHGAKLAHIRGHSGEITPKEIALCREHALKRLKTWEKNDRAN